MLAVLASLGPIVIFFGLSTENYPFMILLNEVTSTVAGVLGLKFLLQTLDRLVVVQQETQPVSKSPVGAEDTTSSEPASEGKPEAPTAALEPTGKSTTIKAKSVFTVWTTVFALVGAQMSWVLRPFIGCPTMPFEWFREKESNFFIAVSQALIKMFSI
jgi:hypothetical protein